MQTFKQFLQEARQYPDKNPKQSVLEQLEQLYAKYPNAFCSFTYKPKLGINPQSEFNTPIGIYAYPIDYVIEKNLKVPYPEEPTPYICVFIVKPTANILQVSMESNEYTKWKRAICNVLDLDLPTLFEIDTKRMWHIMYNYINFSLTGNEYFDPLDDNPDPRFKTLSTKILRTAGYDGVVDPGWGVIHPNEPEQAVFFNLSQLQVVDRIKYVEYRKHTPKVHRRIGSEEQWKRRFLDALEYRKRDRDVERFADQYYTWSYEVDLAKIVQYCINVQQRIPAFEQYIIRDPGLSVLYAEEVIHGRWPEAEPTILLSARSAAKYAMRALKRRWPEAEDKIFSDAWARQWYKKHFNIKG